MAGMQSPNGVRISHEQRVILEALSQGARGEEIAALTNKARSTVETHIRSLFQKFNARSRTHLVALAFRRGILSIVVTDDVSQTVQGKVETLRSPE
jgi:DNA-binding NarL/FixJ family response regulator